MRIAVTGSSGFIGTPLMGALRAAGHEAVALVRRAPRAGAHEIGWDPDEDRIDAASLEGVDAAIHLAGVGIGSRRWSAHHRAAVLGSRVRGTRLLARTLAGLGAPPRALLSASAIGFYGNRGSEPLTEVSEGGTGFLADVCRRWEEETEPARDAGIRVVRLRSALVLSSRGGILQRMLLPFRLGLGGRIGDGAQYWSWITLRDEIGALLHLLAAEGVAGPVNLAAPQPVTNLEFTRTLGRVLGRPTPLSVPAPALRLALGREMAEEMVLAGQRVLPEALRTSGFSWSDPVLEPALRSLLGKEHAAT
jgi:uncharacterized protein (TIGR01777 family)